MSGNLAEELREYTAIKYMGDCKCGRCQLVPRELIDRIYAVLVRLYDPNLFNGCGLAMRRIDEPPIPGEPLASMAEMKEALRDALTDPMTALRAERGAGS